MDGGDFGVDWEGPVNTCGEEEITIPETVCPLEDADFEELKHSIQPLSHSTEYGIDLYERTVQFVLQKVDRETQ